MIVRGSGFSAISNLAARVSLSGVPDPSVAVTPVNDTEFIVTAPAQLAQQSTVSISNSLNIAPAARNFSIIDPQTYSYAKHHE